MPTEKPLARMSNGRISFGYEIVRPVYAAKGT